MASDDEDVPDSGAVFTFGKSRFLDNKFWIRDDAVTHLACGDEHSAVVTENGKLYTFGSNDWGQLGHGNTVQFPSPKLVKRLKPEKVKLAAAGRNHTIVSTESGKLFSFGCGSDGQLGHGDCENSTVPKAIESLSDQQYKMLACGSDFTAAVTAEGQLYTWGSSSEGQTGQGSEDCVVPTKVHLRGKVVAVACGYYHMAVATGDGALYMCGEIESGKLGLDDSQLGDTSQLQKLSLNEQVTAVACGGNHTAAITASGKLFTFGQGNHGQLGHGSSCSECPTPKQVTCLGNIRVKYVACGESHTAVITKHGNLYTCGDGRHGKLGMGEESFSNLFKLEKVRRFDGFTVQKAACGGCHTLVTAFKTSELNEGTDSEAEAENDTLTASISSTKSLQDAVDGPSGYRSGLAATLPAGGAARNKRRQRNIESLGNSIGGSLPPISKSTLPPLSRTLPALKKELSKEEKIPVNPLDMSTLPQISQGDQAAGDKQRGENSTDRKETKVAKPSKKPKDAESSSGISESEEEDEDEDDEDQDKKKNDKIAVSKETKEEDIKKKDEESEESMTQDESDSEEERTTDKTKTAELKPDKDHKTDKVPSKKEEEEEESEDDEESDDDEEDDEESTGDEQKPDKNEQLKVVGKKIEVTKVEKKKEEEDYDEEESEEEESGEEEEEDEDEEDEDKAKKKNKQQKEPKKKEKDKETDSKKETEDETEEEEEEDEEGDSEAADQTKGAEKDKKAKEKMETKKKKKKNEKKENEEGSDQKKADNKKDKKKDKKEKGKDSEEEEEEEEEDAEVDKDDGTEEKGDQEEENSKDKTDKKGKTKGYKQEENKKEDKEGKSEAAKPKEKKSGICLIL